MSRIWCAKNYKQVGRTQPEKKLISGKCKVKINTKIEFLKDFFIRLTFVDAELITQSRSFINEFYVH